MEISPDLHLVKLQRQRYFWVLSSTWKISYTSTFQDQRSSQAKRTERVEDLEAADSYKTVCSWYYKVVAHICTHSSYLVFVKPKKAQFQPNPSIENKEEQEVPCDLRIYLVDLSRYFLKEGKASILRVWPLAVWRPNSHEGYTSKNSTN